MKFHSLFLNHYLFSNKELFSYLTSKYFLIFRHVLLKLSKCDTFTFYYFLNVILILLFFFLLYLNKKWRFRAEVKWFVFLTAINDLIMVVVIMFIKFFQCSKCCSTWTIVFLIIFIVIFLLMIHSCLITYLDILNTTNYLLITALR